jgi:hypothetical protein
VAVRVRPLLPLEPQDSVCLFKVKNQPQLVLGKERSFTFDHVFDTRSQQEELSSDCVRPLIDSLFLGYNATIFAYGQTGSGKTYTMGSAAPGASETRGIIPRAISEIFERVSRLRATHRFQLRVSFLEIYNEEIRDLLDPRKGKVLAVREDSEGGVSVVGAEEEIAGSAEQMLQCLHRGTLARTTGATNMNEVRVALAPRLPAPRAPPHGSRTRAPRRCRAVPTPSSRSPSSGARATSRAEAARRPPRPPGRRRRPPRRPRRRRRRRAAATTTSTSAPSSTSSTSRGRSAPSARRRRGSG